MIRLVVLLLVGYCSASERMNNVCTTGQTGELKAESFGVVFQCDGGNYIAIGCQIHQTDDCFNINELTLALNYSAKLAAYHQKTFANLAADCGEMNGHNCVCATVNAVISAHPDKENQELLKYALSQLAVMRECANIQSTRIAKHTFYYINMAVKQTECVAKLPTRSAVGRTNVCEVTGSVCIDLDNLMHVAKCSPFLTALGCEDDSCMCNKLNRVYEGHDKLPDKTGLWTLHNMTHGRPCPAVEDRLETDKHAYYHAKRMSAAMVGSDECAAAFEAPSNLDDENVHYFTSTKNNTMNNNVVFSVKVRCISARNLEKNLHCNLEMKSHVQKMCSAHSDEQCKLNLIQALYDKHNGLFDSHLFEKTMDLGACERREDVVAPSADHVSGHEAAQKASLECVKNLEKPEAFETCIIDLKTEKLTFWDIDGHLSCNSHLKDTLKCASTGCSCVDIAKLYARHAGNDVFIRVMKANLGAEVVPATPRDQWMEVHMKDSYNLFMEVVKGEQCFAEKKLETVADNFICVIQIEKPTSMPGMRSRIYSGKCVEINNLGSSNICHPSLKKLLPQAVELFTSGKKDDACAELQSFYDIYHTPIVKYLVEDALDITECAEVRKATRVQIPQNETFSHVYNLVADIAKAKNAKIASML